MKMYSFTPWLANTSIFWIVFVCIDCHLSLFLVHEYHIVLNAAFPIKANSSLFNNFSFWDLSNHTTTYMESQYSSCDLDWPRNPEIKGPFVIKYWHTHRLKVSSLFPWYKHLLLFIMTRIKAWQYILKKSVSNYRMDFWRLTIRIILFSKCITRMLVIFSLIFYYLFLYYRDCTIKSTCLNVMYLMPVNILISLSSGVLP